MASWAGVSGGVRSQVEARQAVPDPKPPRREKANREAWEQIRAAFADACCVSCGLPAQSLHHAVPKSQGGSDIIANLVPLCGDGVRGCHGCLETHGRGWERVAAAVRVYIWSRESRLRYVRGKLGTEGFDRRYPDLGGAATGFNQGASPFNRPDEIEGVAV